MSYAVVTMKTDFLVGAEDLRHYGAYSPTVWVGRVAETDDTTPPQAPRLLDRVRQQIRARHMSPRTEEAYVTWIRRFILYHKKRHPAEMGSGEVNTFLTHLACDTKVAASTQNQALSAILFLYNRVLLQDIGDIGTIIRAKRPKRVPVVLTQLEAKAVIARMTGPPRFVATLLYGSGLRLLECLRLRVKDVDFGRLEITVRDGKGKSTASRCCRRE